MYMKMGTEDGVSIIQLPALFGNGFAGRSLSCISVHVSSYRGVVSALPGNA